MAAALRLGYRLVGGTRHPQPLGVGAKPIADVGKAVEREDSGCKRGLGSGLPSDRERDFNYPHAPYRKACSTAPPSVHGCKLRSPT